MFKTTLSGNIGKDSEAQQTKDGRDFITFSVGVTNLAKGKDQQGKWQTDWIQVKVFNEKRLQYAYDNALKGAKFFATGSLVATASIDNNGSAKVWLTFYPDEFEIVAGVPRENQQEKSAPNRQTQNNRSRDNYETNDEYSTRSRNQDDGIPF